MNRDEIAFLAFTSAWAAALLITAGWLAGRWF
jgi:hypothetical protein